MSHRLVTQANIAGARTKKKLPIHLIPKWRPINYSFVCMVISPLCLIFTPKFFCVFYMLTRHQGLVNMQTKEKFIGRHFGIRCIEQRLHTISISYFKQMKSNEHKLNHLFPLLYQNQYSTRSQAKGIVAVPPARTKKAANSFIIKASRHFNNELTGKI